MPSDPEDNSKMMEFGKTSEHSMLSGSETSTSTSVDSNSLLNSESGVPGRELTPSKRERRKSPATSFGSDNTSTSVQAPMSPTSADTTFEPTIDMMVNDFDDEATLNEEEALADLEAHNPEDEIARLREESEMPIEELLAKYGGNTDKPSDMTLPLANSLTRSDGTRRRREPRQRQHVQENAICDEVELSEVSQPSEYGADGGVDDAIDQNEDLDDLTSVSAQFNDDIIGADEIPAILAPEVPTRQHRSHLLDLYPDESFGEDARTMSPVDDAGNLTPLQSLFDEGEAEAEDDEDTDTDSDDARKIIMVGPDYQAEIPEGLSQYGDILPYENEDQLIWSVTSQVSEREVEDYLTKVQETRPVALVEDSLIHVPIEGGEHIQDAGEAAVLLVTENIQSTPSAGNEVEPVIKDNEQALHLLVQCGYDFKEALRRKRLNVLPLSSDTMSSWSEEECQKFEEGIQKFGKDFYQIRQNQVRTRTMRELVQFYYLWKKSERRDQSFALNDTIDHMDIFINEGGERAGNGNGNGNGSGSGSGNGSCSSHTSSGSSNGHGTAEHMHDVAMTTRKTNSKSYSIMTGNNNNNNNTACASGTSRKRRGSFAIGDDGEDDINMAEN